MVTAPEPSKTAVDTAFPINTAEHLAGKRVLVTGASGFIGSRLVEKLLNLGAEVIAVAPTPGWRPSIAGPIAQERVRFIPQKLFRDTFGAEQTESDFLDPEYLVHLAHVMPNGVSFAEQITNDIRLNVLGTARLLQHLPASLSKICFASSVMVYGNSPPLPVSESACVNPSTPYAAGKVAVENYLKLFARESGTPLSILRFSTVYGPFELVPRAIPNFIRWVLAGKPPVISGRGDDVRDYVHVSDVIEATSLALADKGDSIDIFNVGTGIGYSTNEIAKKIIRSIGREIDPLYVEAKLVPTEIVCDISHARTVLGYRPKVQIDQGIEEEINFFTNYPQFWRES